MVDESPPEEVIAHLPTQARVTVTRDAQGVPRWLMIAASAVDNKVGAIDSTVLFDNFIHHAEESKEYIGNRPPSPIGRVAGADRLHVGAVLEHHGDEVGRRPRAVDLWATGRAEARQQVEQERLVRLAKLSERVNQALEETNVGYERDRLPEALTAIKRAEALLASDNGASTELRQRVDQWRAELTILEHLEELGFSFSRDQARETDAAYSKVFLDIGINIDEMPVEEAGKRIRSRLTWQRLTEALDWWAVIRHETEWSKDI